MIEPIYNREYFKNRPEELLNRHIDDIQDLIEFFKCYLGLNCHIQYGTLLGAIRENNFIMHDKDIDLSYISKHNNILQVKQELYGILYLLESNEMLVKNFNDRGQMHVRVPNGSLVVDMWTSWIDENNKYNLIPFGIIGNADIIYPLRREGLLRNVYFDIPNQSEILLDILYKDWHNPIIKDKNYLKLPKRSTL